MKELGRESFPALFSSNCFIRLADFAGIMSQRRYSVAKTGYIILLN